MAVELDHTIVHATDPGASARFLTDLLGLDPPDHTGHFWAVEVANGVTLDYDRREPPITSQHYAFLVDEDAFAVPYGGGDGAGR